jgi:long-subunit acyl-CoA synthetase (AMP-forming)
VQEACKVSEIVIAIHGTQGPSGALTYECRVTITSQVTALANGTKFAPQFIENKLKFSPYIKEAVTVGQDRPYVVAMINIDMENVGKWHHGVPSEAELTQALAELTAAEKTLAA